MKSVLYFIIALVFSGLISCNSDDDICTGGEATPRIKLKFKTAAGKLMQPDSLYVSVDYGKGAKALTAVKSPDSLLIPIRVDENLYTDMYVKMTKKGDSSKIRLNYTTESQYVSPACGIKKKYKNFAAELMKALPIKSVETVQNDISDEKKTAVYLHF